MANSNSQAVPPAGDAGSGSGADNSEGATTTSQSAAPTPTPPSLEQFQLDQILADPRVRKAMDDQAAGIKSKYLKKQQNQTTQPPAQAVVGEVAELLATALAPFTERLGSIETELQTAKAAAAETAFDAEFAAQGLPDVLKQPLLDSFRANKPADLSSWMSQYAQGLSGSTSKPGSRPETPTPGAPPSAARRTEEVSLQDLTREDIVRLQSEGRFMQVLERARLQGTNGQPMPFSKRPLPK